jgi:hypothetical protein
MFTSLQIWLKRTSHLLPVLLLPLAAHAQVPVNDDPAGAINLPLNTTCLPTSATNAGATTSPASFVNPGCGIATAPKDVWFRFTTDPTGPGSTAAAIAVTGTPAGQVRVFSSAGGPTAPFTSIGCSAGTAVNTQAPRLVVQSLTPSTTYYVFVSGYGSNDTQGPFTICASQVVPNDLSVEAVQTLTQLPIPQGAPHVVRAVVSNQGLSTQLPVAVTLTVTGANTFTSTQTIASLAAGASTTVSFAGFTPTATGTNTLTVTVSADGNNANNSRSATQVVNTGTYSYADPGPATTGRGFFSTIIGRAFACRYAVNSPVNVTQVRSYVVNRGGLASGPASTIGKTVYGVVLDAGTGTLLARSANYVITAADIDTYLRLPLTQLVAVPAGTDLFVGMVQVYPAGQTETYFPYGQQNDAPGRTGAFYNVPLAPGGTPPSDIGVSIQGKFMMEAVTVPTTPCPGPTNLTATSSTNTGATLAFTPPSGASSYTLAYTANGGAPTTLTPAPTGSPIVLSGLSPATAYAVTLSTNCGSQLSLPATVSFITTQSGGAYATLPVAESFEGPWLSVAAVRDAPATNWRNTPASGVQSWRREDDGVSANWVSDAGGYTVGGSQGLHSARFHTYEAPAGSSGALDLYVNMSPAGTKTLSFDYVNSDGTDRLDVLVSTDGGATFGIPVLTVGATGLSITTATVPIASTSATTVIRFRATSDFGVTDFVIDNVRLALVTATRSGELAAQVGLYPNPARGAFAVTVPAGPLGAATATLHNALGQVVQQRPLGLPAAGGTTSFDVRGLAAGVYTLQLLSGETLVVKRVVLE